MSNEKWDSELWADIYTILIDKEESDQIEELVREKVNQVAKDILQSLFYRAKYGTQDSGNAFAFACNQMKTKILAKAKEYGVEINDD